MEDLTYEEFVSLVVREFPIQLQSQIEEARLFHDSLESSLESLWRSLSSSEPIDRRQWESEPSWITQAVNLVNNLTGVLSPYGDNIDYAQYASWVASKEQGWEDR